MQTQYSEQDTERARTAERSSAGRQTQQLGRVPGQMLAAQPLRGRNNAAAVALIVLGVLGLVGRGFGLPLGEAGPLAVLAGIDLTAGMFFLTVASCFLFFAFWKRIYGLMIPGCIIAGFAAGVTFAGLLGGAPFFWGVSLGFLAIYLLGRRLFNVSSPWPLFPGVGLLAFGAVIASASLPGILSGSMLAVPLLLIGAGLYLGFGRRSQHP
jgi:hypothetical protein